MRKKEKAEREKEEKEKGDITTNVKKRHANEIEGSKLAKRETQRSVLSATRPPLRRAPPHKARVPVIVICQDAS